MNSLILKRHIGKLYPIFKNTSRKIILIYHSVGNTPWALAPDMFKKQIQWLKAHCEIVPLTKLLTQVSAENKVQVSLTFDDGYACLYDTVLPILQAENATAMTYINTGWMGESDSTRKASNPDLGHYPNEKFLTWDEVKDLEKFGWEIGSHGVEHYDLTRQPQKIIQQELTQSKEIIENKLSKACPHFAYTFGNHNTLLQKNVKKAGYRYAVAAHHAAVKKNSNPMAIPRLNIEKAYSLVDFKNIVQGKWDFLGTIHRVKRLIQS